MKQKDTNSDGAACAAVVRVLDSAQGPDISVYDEGFLRKSIDKRLAATGFETVAAYCDYLAGDGEEAKAFHDSLRIGYSDFFRSPLVFELLRQMVLPSLAAEKARSGQGEIRVWSAGCAAGQEAWSIAMLLDEVAGADSPSFSYRIFATDLSEPDLALARDGIYSDEALGNVRLRQLSRFFSRQGDAYAVLPRLREKVCFSSYDLLDERSSSPAVSIYGDFDLVFCCNLLFYYRQSIRQRILDKVCRALAPGGYFVTGEAERDIVSNRNGLCAVSPSVAVFQKRREKA